MKNLSLAVLAFLCGSSAFAQNLNFVSETCDHASKLESTGFVLSWNKQVYVLASADFVYNGNQPKFCHQIADLKGGAHPLKLSRYDWSTGLALLKGDDSLAALATQLSSVAPKILITATWPGGSGQVVSAHSRRHHFPAIDETLELKATDTDAHKVGSAITNASGQIVGFIADQLIEEVPGHSARVARWLDRAGITSRQLIIISSISVSKWLENVLLPDWTSPFKIEARDQLQKKYRITAGPITFTEDCPPPDLSPGNNPNYPIGGGDPVGIGGDSASAPACIFHVSKAETSNTTNGLPEIRKAWFARLENYLQKNVDTVVMLGHYRDESHLLQSKAMVSLGSFGQSLLQSETGFLLRLKGENAPHETELVELRKAAPHLIAEVVRDYWSPISVRQRGYLYGFLTLSDDWQEVSLQDLQVLYEDAYNDPKTLKYVYDDVQALINLRKALEHP